MGVTDGELLVADDFGADGRGRAATGAAGAGGATVITAADAVDAFGPIAGGRPRATDEFVFGPV